MTMASEPSPQMDQPRARPLSKERDLIEEAKKSVQSDHRQRVLSPPKIQSPVHQVKVQTLGSDPYRDLRTESANAVKIQIKNINKQLAACVDD